MRKLIVLFVTILLATSAHAQFTLTKEGFVNSKDPKKTYYVEEIPGKSQSELFSSVLNHLRLSYALADNWITTTGKEAIALNVSYDRQILEHDCGSHSISRETNNEFIYNHYKLTAFSVIFKFKDGRIRIESPKINNLTYADNKVYLYNPGGKLWYKNIFNENGSVKEKELKSALESYFNEFITSVTAVGSDNDW